MLNVNQQKFFSQFCFSEDSENARKAAWLTQSDRASVRISTKGEKIVQSKLDQIINPRALVFGLVLLGVVALSGRASGMLTGHPIEFDLQTDNYVGTHNFQVDIGSPDIQVINSEFVKISGVGTESRADKKGIVRTVYDSVKMARVYKGVDELYGRLMPSASAADAIVFAVYMPPQAPAPGQELRTI